MKNDISQRFEHYSSSSVKKISDKSQEKIARAAKRGYLCKNQGTGTNRTENPNNRTYLRKYESRKKHVEGYTKKKQMSFQLLD